MSDHLCRCNEQLADRVADLATAIADLTVTMSKGPIIVNSVGLERAVDRRIVAVVANSKHHARRH